MSSATNLLESKMGEFVLLSSSPTKPTALWLALYIDDTLPGEAVEAGEEVAIEDIVFGLHYPTGYGRLACGPSSSYWIESTINPGQFYNLLALTFPSPIRNWGNITGWALHDDEVAGSVWLRGTLSVPLDVYALGPAPSFAAGALVINFQ